MGKNSVHIIYSDGRGIYRPGDTVGGTVKLIVGDLIKFRKSPFLDTLEQGQNEEITYEGVYNSPFSIQLPGRILSSYQGSCGRVRYELEVIVVRPWTSNLSRQMVATDEKTVYSVCFASGPITATITTECQGYVPGAAIKFWAEIRNDSSKNIKYSKAKFIMRVAYNPGYKTRIVDYVLHKLRGKRVPGGRTDTWSGEKLFIPPLPPTSLQGSSIIKIQHFVTITVVPSRPACNLVVPAEMIIGTIPIQKEGQPLPRPYFKENEIIKGDGFSPLYPCYDIDRQLPKSNFGIAH